MGTPTVAIFGPTSPDFGFGPLAPRHVVAGVEGLACRPCDARGPQRCPLGHWQCMRSRRRRLGRSWKSSTVRRRPEPQSITTTFAPPSAAPPERATSSGSTLVDDVVISAMPVNGSHEYTLRSRPTHAHLGQEGVADRIKEMVNEVIQATGEETGAWRRRFRRRRHWLAGARSIAKAGS